MIRLLQKDNRATKAIFAVIIGLAIISMVVYLIPGLYDGLNGTPQGVYATVRTPGLLGRLSETTSIKSTEVARMAQLLAQRQGLPPQYLQFLMPRFEQQAGQMLVAGAIEQREAERLGLVASDASVNDELHQSQLGQILFPDGKYIGDDKYLNFVQSNGFNTRAEFESRLRDDISRAHLIQFVSAGAGVSDNAVREEVRQQGLKVKFDYAVISGDEIAKTLNPIDSDLQTYYTQHKADYHVDEQVKVRHILIKAAPGDAKADTAAKTKAQEILTKIRGGADFAALARANSDDPGSKDSGGELGFVKRNHQMVPEFEKAAMALQTGQTSDLVKTNFGYHIIQAEQHDQAHDRPLSEVAAEIGPVLEQQRAAGAVQGFAQQLAGEAAKSGLANTAAAHHLNLVTTDPVSADGTLPNLPQGGPLLQAAFTGRQGDAPRVAPAGQSAAFIYQVAHVLPARTPTFAEWRSHIQDDYRQEQVPQLLQSKLAKLADRAKALGSLSKAAAELNVPVKTSDLVDRTANVPQVGQMSGAAAVAFTLPQGGVSGPLSGQGSGSVLQVVDKQEPTSEEIAKAFPALKQQLLERRRAEVFGVYMGTLMDQYKNKGGIRIMQQPRQPELPVGS